MALLPYLFDDSSCLFRPSKMLNHFGVVLDADDFLDPLTMARLLLQNPPSYIPKWKSPKSDEDFSSTVTFDNERFQANLDVQQFTPEEITVKITGENTVVVEGKHEEKEDEHGQIFRHFRRTYTLPKNCDMNKIESKLSSDGVLSITAPTIDAKQIEHKSIPVTQTEQPVNQVEKK